MQQYICYGECQRISFQDDTISMKYLRLDLTPKCEKRNKAGFNLLSFICILKHFQ